MANDVNRIAEAALEPLSSQITHRQKMLNSSSGKLLPPSGEIQATNKPTESSASSEGHKSSSTQEIKDAAEKLTSYARTAGHKLQFEIDASVGQALIKVIDSQTQEVVRQIPSEEAVAMAQMLSRDEMHLINDFV